jgi:plasmid stability protein
MNLTITIDDEVLKRARVRALQQGTSVNAIVREYLEAFAGGATVLAARRRFAALARVANSGSEGRRTWTRDDLHDR